MGINYGWEDEAKTIMRFTFEEDWSWKDYYEMRPESDKAIAEIGHKVGGIIEMPRNIPLERGVLSHAQTITKSMPDNLIVLVVVTESVLVKAMLGTAKRLFGKNVEAYRQAATLEEARAIIGEALAAKK